MDRRAARLIPIRGLSGCLAKGGFGALLTDGADYPDGGFAQEAGFA